ncbi:MAG: cation transporter [Sedimentisphaerales bacterium]|nr:cation transporter [Sedimentisphaerales bacterium]
MEDIRQITATKQLRLVTFFSIAANAFFLVPVKFTVGILTGSLSLVADGIHSATDMLTDLAVLIGIHLGSKKPDADHPFGHGKLETLSAAGIALGLLAVGLAMVYYAAHDIAKGNIHHPGNPVLIVAGLSIVVKEIIFRVTKRVAVKYHCPAALANAWHDRADALASVAVIIGVVAQKFGFNYGDQVAAVVVGIMVSLVASGIFRDCLAELTERAVDEVTIAHIKDIINAESQIRQWHRLRTRGVGREIFLDLHILVDPNLSISDAHDVSERLETAIHRQLTRPVNVIIHVEPDLPQLRK